MTNEEIHAEISALVDEEHRLRGRGAEITDDERGRLRAAEQHLDQLWDLLRRRDALRRAGQDPDAAREQPVAEVETYLQ